jgi:cytochrome c-type biogenesis protein CcmH/NrfG
MSEWRAMLGIAELRITMDDGDGGYYPWLQEGLALQGLGRLDESKHALLKALRLFPDEPNVKETLAEVRAALRRAPRN